MIVKLFVERVINEKTKFNDVPNSLKEDVKKILIEKGFENLCV